MSLLHKPYPKVALTVPDETIVKGEWVATEKIHGANLTVATDGNEVRIGKRKAWLEPHDPFFGWQLLQNDLKTAALTIHEQINKGECVRIFGELFGGGYPHPDVPKVAGLSPVQTGVWYSPDLCFVVFDILHEQDDGEMFLSFDDVVSLCAEVNLQTPPLIGRRPSDRLFALSCQFQTRVPEQLGLSPIENNFAEGLVVKPSSALAPDRRPAVKKKIPVFSETRFDESKPFDPHAVLDFDALITVAKGMVNPMRLASARSKVGNRPTDILDEAVLDVMIDLEAALPTTFQMPTSETETCLRDTLVQLALPLLSEK